MAYADLSKTATPAPTALPTFEALGPEAPAPALTTMPTAEGQDAWLKRFRNRRFGRRQATDRMLLATPGAATEKRGRWAKMEKGIQQTWGTFKLTLRGKT